MIDCTRTGILLKWLNTIIQAMRSKVSISTYFDSKSYLNYQELNTHLTQIGPFDYYNRTGNS